MTKNHRLPVFAPEQRATIRGDCLAGTVATGSFAERVSGQRQCLQIACRHNLLMVTSESRPGRRHDGMAPEWTVSGGNTSAGAPSCALDVADTGPKTSREIAAIFGCTTRRIEQELRSALSKKGAVELARLDSSLMENGE